MAFINTVPSKNQLAPNLWVSFEMGETDAKRVLFVGNSITRHGPADYLGWFGDWGMAASTIDNDYVHLTAAALKERWGAVDICVTQAADWERNYTDPELLARQYSAAHDFHADVVVIRLGENVIRETFDYEAYVKAYADMVHFFAPKEGAKIILTDLVWTHEGIDRGIHEAAANLGLPVIGMNDIGEDDSYSAKGLFEHAGVAGHPGDKGMREIADRILKAILCREDSL